MTGTVRKSKRRLTSSRLRGIAAPPWDLGPCRGWVGEGCRMLPFCHPAETRCAAAWSAPLSRSYYVYIRRFWLPPTHWHSACCLVARHAGRLATRQARPHHCPGSFHLSCSPHRHALQFASRLAGQRSAQTGELVRVLTIWSPGHSHISRLVPPVTDTENLWSVLGQVPVVSSALSDGMEPSLQQRGGRRATACR